MEKNSEAVLRNKKVSNYIPDEISFSILSKLPLKSLKRFECVQKSWSFLFQNHHFINMFLNKSLSYSNDPASLILKASENYYKEVFYSLSGERFENKVKLDLLNSVKNHLFEIRVFDSVNGTLCLHGHHGDIALWNPVSQTTKLLPYNQTQLAELSMPDEAEYYVDFSVNYYIHGFGYDQVTNDYKVIRYVTIDRDLLREYPYDQREVTLLYWLISLDNIEPFWEIYSLRSNSWRKLHIDVPYSLQDNDCTQVYMDGVCHWLSEHYYAEPCLVSFYLCSEKFFKTPIPSYVYDCFDVQPWWINVAVLNRSIALISYYNKTTSFHISLLGEFGTEKSWIKFLIVGPLFCVERPIGVGMKGEIFFKREDGKLVWLDLSTQMIAELGGYTGDAVQIIIYK